MIEEYTFTPEDLYDPRYMTGEREMDRFSINKLAEMVGKDRRTLKKILRHTQPMPDGKFLLLDVLAAFEAINGLEPDQLEFQRMAARFHFCQLLMLTKQAENK